MSEWRAVRSFDEVLVELLAAVEADPVEVERRGAGNGATAGSTSGLGETCRCVRSRGHISVKVSSSLLLATSFPTLLGAGRHGWTRSMRFMLNTRIRSWIALGCVLGLGALAYVFVSRPRVGIAVQVPTGTNDGSATSAVSTSSRKALGAEMADGEVRGGRLRQQDDVVQPEDEDEDEGDWDKLSAAERRAKLEGEFSRALGELEAGGGSPLVVAQAEWALSELRAQMYSTPSGRKEHEALEERLSTVTEERKEDDADEEK